MRRPLVVDLLRVVTRPYWLEHRLRTALTVLGVALGVATVIGMADVNATVLDAFRRMVSTIAGDTELEVTSPLGRVDEALLEQAAAVPGVQAAAGVVEAFVAVADRPAQSLYLLGVDFLGSQVWESQFPRDAITLEDEIVFVGQPGSVALTQAFLDRENLQMGGTLAVLTPGGRRDLHVRGVLGPVTPARLFDGAIAVMDLPAAQRLLERGDRVDRIAVQLLPGTDVEVARRLLAAALGPAVEVASPEARGQQVEELLFSLRTMLATMSSTAVMVGLLIVFHTVAASVRQRRRQFALLNVAGVSPRVIVRLCLLETLLLALVGVVLGIGGGLFLGRLGARVVGGAVADIWVRVDIAGPAHSIVGGVTGVLSGLLAALVAAALAIRATFTSTTVEALRPPGFAWEQRPTRGRDVAGPLLLLAGSWLILLAPRGSASSQ